MAEEDSNLSTYQLIFGCSASDIDSEVYLEKVSAIHNERTVVIKYILSNTVRCVFNPGNSET